MEKGCEKGRLFFLCSLGGRVFHNLSPEAFSTVLRGADLFVRPTDRDGDAVSAREARWFSIPVIASDAVPRPDGTIVFRTGDARDFSAKMCGVFYGSLLAKDSTEKQSAAFDWPEFYRQIIEIGPVRCLSKIE